MSRKAADLAGQKFHRLSAVSRAPYVEVAGMMRLAWNCICDCGAVAIVTSAALKSGNTKSCGCFKRENAGVASITHGLSNHPLYQRWAGMIQRCTNPNHVGYANYGGRGIKVCERWMSFENFLADMGECPSDDHSIERKESDDDYESNNCKWATSAEQSRNTSRNVIIAVGEKSLTVRDWEIELGLGRGAIQRRIDLGWPHDRAVTEPIQPGKSLKRREECH